MEVRLETALMKASAAALFAGGLGRVLLIHASDVVYPLYSPGICIRLVVTAARNL